jgi:radical SAM protein with 4Fe4S-binding SPASM domain
MKLKRIYIEISNICNIQCSFCPVVDRDNQIMSVEQFKHVVSQAAPLANEVCLHLMGEPLAHPKFADILTACDEVGVKVQITTNGLLLAKQESLLLSHKCIRQINFSLQSYKDNFPHKELSGYLTPLMDFTRELHEARPEVYINFRMWNVGTKSDNEEIFELVERYYQTEIKRNIQVENIKSKRVWNRVYLHFDSRFEWPSLDYPFQGEVGRCHALVSHIGIHADGTVVPCCLDKEAELALGNCYETPLKDILNSSRAVSMKEGFLANKLKEKLCQHCDYIQRFNK